MTYILMFVLPSFIKKTQENPDGQRGVHKCIGISGVITQAPQM